MKSRFRYHRPDTLADALEFLAANAAEAALLAGGTDLMISIRRGDLGKQHVVDVSRLPELRQVEQTDQHLAVGAAATFTELIGNSLVGRQAPVLVAAARQIGSRQIRNVGTIGGNVANASPAADSVPALLVHNAQAIMQSSSRSRREPLSDVIVAAYRTSLKPGELIVGFDLEPLEGYRCSFHRIARRRALGIARINAAAAARLDDLGRVVDLRLAVGSVTPSPGRFTDAERVILGERPTPRLIQEAAERVSSEMIRRSGVRPSTEYKKPAVEGLVTKVLIDVFA